MTSLSCFKHNEIHLQYSGAGKYSLCIKKVHVSLINCLQGITIASAENTFSVVLHILYYYFIKLNFSKLWTAYMIDRLNTADYYAAEFSYIMGNPFYQG